MNRITEEYKEVTDTLWSDDLAHIAQELADLVYVAYGTAIALGINLDAAITAVHQANMAKLDSAGRPIYRADGKVIKPAGWTPPDMTAAVSGAL
jgi:predicted HAD superfamily Cof-like phosphohydrolase